MTLYDLRGKEMYVGSRKIGKAYFNNEIVFGKPALVFPEPPKTTRDRTWQYFYGGGEVVSHGGELSLPSEINSSIMKRNGLHPTGNIVAFAGGWNNSWDLVITIENPRANSTFRNTPLNNNILTTGSNGITVSLRATNQLFIQSMITHERALVDLPPETTKSITIYITQDRDIRSGKYYYYHQVLVNGASIMNNRETSGHYGNKYVDNFTLHNPNNKFVYYATSYSSVTGRLHTSAAELTGMSDKFVLTDQL